MDKTPAPGLWSLLLNPVGLAGLFLCALCTAIGLPMMFVDMIADVQQPYLGALIYLVLPAGAGAGLLVAAAGMLLERRRRARQPGKALPPLPKLDLNETKDKVALAAILAAVLTLAALLSITSYRAYNYSDSVQFCGQVCHQVMEPEFTAYQRSPHARVACVACHVGPGAGWFVRSKFSGAYQVYATAFDKFPRPIKTPVRNLRPAQETCEQCHWPAKFFGGQQKLLSYHLADEKNSPWKLQLLLKIGGGDPALGAASGIHWHMNIKNIITYVSDERRETIPWVRAVDGQGNVREYLSTENPPSAEQLARSATRRMDCVDCHNRPSHIFLPPDKAMDRDFDAGLLDPDLPYLKREGMRLLAAAYSTKEQALDAIDKGLAEFYQKQYPKLSSSKQDSIRKSAQALRNIFASYVFPEMRTDWRAHPDHVGHLNSDGCFRCHDGMHLSKEGKVLTKDCNACHEILSQGSPRQVSRTRLETQPFRHPVDIGMDSGQMKCGACHTGTTGL